MPVDACAFRAGGEVEVVLLRRLARLAQPLLRFPHTFGNGVVRPVEDLADECSGEPDDLLLQIGVRSGDGEIIAGLPRRRVMGQQQKVLHLGRDAVLLRSLPQTGQRFVDQPRKRHVKQDRHRRRKKRFLAPFVRFFIPRFWIESRTTCLIFQIGSLLFVPLVFVRNGASRRWRFSTPRNASTPISVRRLRVFPVAGHGGYAAPLRGVRREEDDGEHGGVVEHLEEQMAHLRFVEPNLVDRDTEQEVAPPHARDQVILSEKGRMRPELPRNILFGVIERKGSSEENRAPDDRGHRQLRQQAEVSDDPHIRHQHHGDETEGEKRDASPENKALHRASRLIEAYQNRDDKRRFQSGQRVGKGNAGQDLEHKPRSEGNNHTQRVHSTTSREKSVGPTDEWNRARLRQGNNSTVTSLFPFQDEVSPGVPFACEKYIFSRKKHFKHYRTSAPRKTVFFFFHFRLQDRIIHTPRPQRS